MTNEKDNDGKSKKLVEDDYFFECYIYHKLLIHMDVYIHTHKYTQRKT